MVSLDPEYFDFVAAAHEAGLDARQLQELADRWQPVYGSDRHLFEIRMMRICAAIANGACTFEECLAVEDNVGGLFAA